MTVVISVILVVLIGVMDELRVVMVLSSVVSVTAVVLNDVTVVLT